MSPEPNFGAVQLYVCDFSLRCEEEDNWHVSDPKPAPPLADPALTVKMLPQPMLNPEHSTCNV
jgi:hypothetical protein